MVLLSKAYNEYAYLSKNLIIPKELLKLLQFTPKPDRIGSNFYYSEHRNPLSFTYINNAYFLFEVLKMIGFDKNNIVEIGSGNSLVVDLALKYRGFNGILHKINLSIPKIKKLETDFKVELINTDVFSRPQDLPNADAFIFNHAIDDLYIYLWSLDSKINYLNFTDNIEKENEGWENIERRKWDIKKENKYWKDAIRKKSAYVPKIKKMLSGLIQKLKNNGFIIIRCYPSSYEIYNKQNYKIKFNRALVSEIVNFLANNGLKLIIDDSKKIDSKFELSKTFFVLQKNK